MGYRKGLLLLAFVVSFLVAGCSDTAKLMGFSPKEEKHYTLTGSILEEPYTYTFSGMEQVDTPDTDKNVYSIQSDKVWKIPFTASNTSKNPSNIYNFRDITLVQGDVTYEPYTVRVSVDSDYRLNPGMEYTGHISFDLPKDFKPESDLTLHLDIPSRVQNSTVYTNTVITLEK